MHDTLDYISQDPVYRRWHHHKLTFSLVYAFSENFVLSLSHDEVVHLKGSLINKIPGDWWQKFATLRLLFGYQMTHPGKKLLFMGQEFGQWREWSETRSLDWNLVEQFDTHQQMLAWVRDLHKLYREQPALFQKDFDARGFQWIEANDADQSVFSYVRFAEDRSNFLVVVLQLHADPAPQLPHRRARSRLLPGSAEQRCGLLRRRERRQPGRQTGRSDPLAPVPSQPQPDPAAAGGAGVEVGADGSLAPDDFRRGVLQYAPTSSPQSAKRRRYFSPITTSDVAR